MNEILNKFLLAGDKSIPKIHLRQFGFDCKACNPFTKNKERIQKLKNTGDSRHIYQNELDKAGFQHHMVYGDFKNLPRKQLLGKLLQDKALNMAKISKYNGYECGLASMVCKCFDKSSAASTHKGTGINSENQQLVEELHKPIIRKFGKRKVYSSFKDKVWGADLAGMQFIIKQFNFYYVVLTFLVNMHTLFL